MSDSVSMIDTLLGPKTQMYVCDYEHDVGTFINLHSKLQPTIGLFRITSRKHANAIYRNFKSCENRIRKSRKTLTFFLFLF